MRNGWQLFLGFKVIAGGLIDLGTDAQPVETAAAF
jgi:hypothetical protein